MASSLETVRSFFSLFNEGRVDDAFALVGDDVAWWVPGKLPFSGTLTKAQYLGVVGQIRAGFPTGFKLHVRESTTEGERVAVEVESEGQHVSGKTYANKYHFLFRVEGGLIRGVKEYMDTQHLAWLITPA